MTRLNLVLTGLLAGATLANAQTDSSKTNSEIKRNIQITFISPVGTNGIDCYKVSNKISWNVLAGVNGGLTGIEFGGFGNVLMHDMKGIQGAGFVNAVMGDVTGAQGAGFVNYSGGNLTGAAGAGFCNVNLKSTIGVQGSGFANYNGDSLYGVQGAGFCNVNLGKTKGGQFAGFANYNHKEMRGTQASGFLNTNIGEVKGAQFSGFGNVSVGNVEGVQASGFFNYARKVKGAQFSFINIADSVDGASVGFLSFVRKGLHQVELSSDEVFYSNVAFRTGTRSFYNIFSAGMSPKNAGLLWNIGYGVGTSFKVSEKLRSDVSISASHVSKGLFYHATSELYRVYWGVEYKLAEKCYIAGGPTFNMYFGDALLPDFAKTYNKVAPYTLMNETNTQGFNFKGWVGAKVAIRFL